MNKLALNVEEVSLLIGVSKPTVYEWCKKGFIPNIRIGGRTIIPRKKLEEFLEVGNVQGEET